MIKTLRWPLRWPVHVLATTTHPSGRPRRMDRYVKARRDSKIACPEAWETAKAALIARKLLTAAGAITPAGRNAIEAIR